VTAVSLAAVYAAVNCWSVEFLSLDPFNHNRSEAGQTLFALAALATTLYPLGLLGWAVRSRSRLLLDGGILSAALSVVTLRFYIHILPLWAILTVSGAALVLLVLG